MAPTTTDALFTRIGEMFISGSGTAPYQIPAGTFSMEWYWEGRQLDSLATHALTKPQVKVTLLRMTDSRAWPKPSDQTMYRVEFEVNVVYFTDSKLLKSVRTNLAKQIGTDIHLISKALQHPGNLTQTDAGADTGLAGGLLQMSDEPVAFEFDPDASVVQGELTFTGWLVLSNA